MDDYTLTNVATQLFASVVLLVLIFFHMTSRYKNTRINRIFLLLLVLNTVLLVADSLAWIFDRRPGSVMYMAIWLSNFVVFVSSISIYITLFVYVSEVIGIDKHKMQKNMRVTYLISSIGFLMVIFTQFSGSIYFINENNVFVFGPYYPAFLLYAEASFLILTAFILRFRKMIGTRKTLVLISYPLMPAIGLMINVFNQDYIIAHLVMALSLLVIFVNIQMQQENKLKEKEIELMENSISIMLSQIQPHFLYNSLSAISGLCYGNAKAQEAIVTFSEYLRINMDSLLQKRLIPFEKELEHVRQYLWLEKLRFEERLQVIYEIEADKFMLPVLTVQPMVENAVRHGVTQRSSGGTVTVQTKETENSFQILVIDDGVGFDMEHTDDTRSHIGIANVRSRLFSMCKGQLTISSYPGQGTTVIIDIPKEV